MTEYNYDENGPHILVHHQDQDHLTKETNQKKNKIILKRSILPSFIPSNVELEFEHGDSPTKSHSVDNNSFDSYDHVDDNAEKQSPDFIPSILTSSSSSFSASPSSSSVTSSSPFSPPISFLPINTFKNRRDLYSSELQEKSSSRFSIPLSPSFKNSDFQSHLTSLNGDNIEESEKENKIKKVHLTLSQKIKNRGRDDSLADSSLDKKKARLKKSQKINHILLKKYELSSLKRPLLSPTSASSANSSSFDKRCTQNRILSSPIVSIETKTNFSKYPNSSLSNYYNCYNNTNRIVTKNNNTESFKNEKLKIKRRAIEKYKKKDSPYVEGLNSQKYFSIPEEKLVDNEELGEFISGTREKLSQERPKQPNQPKQNLFLMNNVEAKDVHHHLDLIEEDDYLSGPELESNDNGHLFRLRRSTRLRKRKTNQVSSKLRRDLNRSSRNMDHFANDEQMIQYRRNPYNDARHKGNRNEKKVRKASNQSFKDIIMAQDRLYNGGLNIETNCSLNGNSISSSDEASIVDSNRSNTFQETFEDVAGLDDHIARLKEMIIWPLVFPEVFKKWNIQIPRGVLFYGPPGTGKTLLAKALVNSCQKYLYQYSETAVISKKDIKFYSRTGTEILSKWIGEAEKNLKSLFDTARENSPSIIFFDEIDGLAPARAAKQDQSHISLVSTLLTLMDGMNDRGQVIVIGATNRISALDPALRRPGRFDKEFYFPLPKEETRLSLIKLQMKRWNENDLTDLSEGFLKAMATKTKDYCGADIKALCTEAVLFAMRRKGYSNLNFEEAPFDFSICQQDFMDAYEAINPSNHRQSDRFWFAQSEDDDDVFVNSLIEPTLLSMKEWFLKRIESDPSLERMTFPASKKRLLLCGDLMTAITVQQFIFRSSKIVPLNDFHWINIGLLSIYDDRSVNLMPSLESHFVKLLSETKYVPSGVIIYLPNIDRWKEALRNTNCWLLLRDFLEHLDMMKRKRALFFLASCSMELNSIPDDIVELFEWKNFNLLDQMVPTTNIIEMKDPRRGKEIQKPIPSIEIE